ncbi:hypothetical protein [Caproicibacter sp. BJN0012]|uniref:hypothetical protein n=1 Tax=Caproicibacter sp. BJN0012 TaxID=3110227 RepID=UPI002E11C24F
MFDGTVLGHSRQERLSLTEFEKARPKAAKIPSSPRRQGLRAKKKTTIIEGLNLNNDRLLKLTLFYEKEEFVF